MEKDKSTKGREEKDLKSLLLNKILSLQSELHNPHEQISSLINFIQSSFEIETVAIYANFSNQKLNLVNSKATSKHHEYIGQMIETIAEQIDLYQQRYSNSLIPISELNIKNLSENDLNTYVYPILSAVSKQIYGIVLITNPKQINRPEEKNICLFVLNYISKIIEDAELASEVNAQDERLNLLSKLTSLLKGILKSDKAIEIVLKEIFNFLRLEDIYFAKWLPQEKKFEITQEITSNKNHSLLGFTHRVNPKNPIVRLLFKNQYLTYKNKNIRKLSRVFLGSKKPSLFCFMPVLARNEMLGAVICLGNSSIEVKTDDLRITKDIASHLAVILNQASLYEESLSTAQREFLLNSITTMIRDTLEVEGVLEKTAREVGQVFGVNACGAFMQNDNESAFIPRSIWATKDEYKEKLAQLPVNFDNSQLMPDPITQSIAIPDLSIINFRGIQPLIDRVECKSYLACSLNKGNKIIGILALAHFESRRIWTSSEVQLLEAITDQVEMALSQAELHEHVQQTERQMNLLHQVSSAIRDSLNLTTVMARAAQDLGEILGVSRCFIRRLKSINPLTVLATEQEYLNKDHNINRASDLILEFEQGWLQSLKDLPEVERANSILHITDIPGKYRNAKDPLKTIIETIQIKSFLGVPLVAAGQVIGSICIHQCDRNRKFTQNEIEFVQRVASEASVAVLNADLFTKVEYQAQRDSLTGLFNHAYFQTALHHEAERIKRTGSDLSIIMIDLDHLKSINDKFGHAAGDEAITLVAGKLQQCLRQMDIIARYGGDEFAILLPETNVEAAELIAKRILDALNRTIHPQWGALSASIGIAGTPHENKDKEIIMKAADDTMYVSKREGRNRVTSSRKLDELGPIDKKPVDR